MNFRRVLREESRDKTRVLEPFRPDPYGWDGRRLHEGHLHLAQSPAQMVWRRVLGGSWSLYGVAMTLYLREVSL